MGAAAGEAGGAMPLGPAAARLLDRPLAYDDGGLKKDPPAEPDGLAESLGVGVEPPPAKSKVTGPPAEKAGGVRDPRGPYRPRTKAGADVAEAKPMLRSRVRPGCSLPRYVYPIGLGDGSVVKFKVHCDMKKARGFQFFKQPFDTAAEASAWAEAELARRLAAMAAADGADDRLTPAEGLAAGDGAVRPGPPQPRVFWHCMECKRGVKAGNVRPAKCKWCGSTELERREIGNEK